MASSSVVELIAELEKIRRAARALLHADSPETIRKIILLEKSKVSWRQNSQDNLTFYIMCSLKWLLKWPR